MGRRWRRPIHGRLVVVWCRSSPPWCRWFCSPQSVVKRKKQESVMFYGFWILDIGLRFGGGGRLLARKKTR
jgi:hypothetical protein